MVSVRLSTQKHSLIGLTGGCLVANATEEFFVRRRPLYEVVGQLGMWGVIISGVQATLIERHRMKTSTWSGRNSLSLSTLRIRVCALTLRFFNNSWALVRLHSWCRHRCFVDLQRIIDQHPIAMFILYTVAPLLYRLASSAYFNLSLLSSDFYGLLFGVSPHFKFRAGMCLTSGHRTLPLRTFLSYIVCGVSNTVSISTSDHTGSTFLHSQLSSWALSSTSGTPRVCLSCDAFFFFLMIFAAEEQGPLNIQTPAYVTQRGEKMEEVNDAEKQVAI